MDAMGELWLPGAERRQVHGGGQLDGGPPRVTWHITYDALNRDGSPAISFQGVTNYLNSVGYQPHLVWDPVTGDIIQLLPADVGGAALEHPPGTGSTNNHGDVHIQIEAYFTPGVVRGGKRYATLLSTPLAGLDRILAWADSFAIPRDAPLDPGNRDEPTWRGTAGHYGHFNTPHNSHIDPIVAIGALLVAGTPPTPPAPEDDMFSDADRAKLDDLEGRVKHIEASIGTGSNDDGLSRRLSDVIVSEQRIEANIAKIAAKVGA